MRRIDRGEPGWFTTAIVGCILLMIAALVVPAIFFNPSTSKPAASVEKRAPAKTVP